MNKRNFLKFALAGAGLLVAEQMIQPAKFIFDYGAIPKRPDLKFSNGKPFHVRRITAKSGNKTIIAEYTIELEEQLESLHNIDCRSEIAHVLFKELDCEYSKSAIELTI